MPLRTQLSTSHSRASAPARANRWFLGLGSNPAAGYRLFCFPFAGGGASAYYRWRLALGSEFEVVAVELPGREGRIDEQPCRSLPALVSQLLEIFPLDRRFALFGHSMGGLLAFELAHALRVQCGEPDWLFISGFRAPHLASRVSPKFDLPTPRLVEEIRKMGGLPREVLECPELLSLLLRPLRGDLEAVETYVHSGKRPLECPITVFGGLADDAVKYGELAEWRQHTNARFRIQMFEGNHFYLYNARQALADSIRGELLTADRTCAMAVTSP